MSAEVHLPLLYRSILKAAQRFPSIRRAAIIADIKHEFHANKVGPDLAPCSCVMERMLQDSTMKP